MINEKKPRLLLVFEILQKTDVEHPLNTTEIIDSLKKYGVNAERKAVLRDLKALQTAGYKIIRCKNHNRGYYMVTHLFEWLIQMDSKVKILRTKELQTQFVEYVRQRYTHYLEQYGL